MEPSPFLTSEDIETAASTQTALFEEPADESDILQPLGEDDQTRLLTSTCHFCGRPVDPKHESTYAEIRTWVHGTKKDSSVLRTYTGLHADSGCIAMLRAGHHPLQKTLDEINSEDPRSDRVTQALATDRSPEWIEGFSAGISGRQVDSLELKSTDFRDGHLEGETHRDFGRIYSKNDD